MSVHINLGIMRFIIERVLDFLLYSSKIKFKPRQLRLAVLKYSLRFAS